MIARIWSGNRRCGCCFLPLSWLYGLVSGVIRLAFSSGGSAWRAPVPVVVVGNLTAGGKWQNAGGDLAGRSSSRGAVSAWALSRGYGGKAERISAGAEPDRQRR